MTEPAQFWMLSERLASGDLTAQALTEECLARIADPAGEGARTFLKVHAKEARAAATESDRLRKVGATLPRFAGIPVSVKDLFDVAGDVTRAGSRLLDDAPAAAADCEAVARLRAAGLVIVGRTNMTEFAYSGLGLNPHYGTPRSPWDRKTGRIPGGSSSGAAVSVTDGMAYAGLGTDTGGSCRIPAAYCGITGWKPTAERVPQQGVLPLSFSLDSVGCLAASVDDCAVIDAIVAGGEATEPVGALDIRGLRLAAPQTLVLDGIDEIVGQTYESALSRIAAAGVTIDTIPLAELKEIGRLSAKGGFPAAEAYAWHRNYLETQRDRYDPRVSVRILRGREQSAADYIDLVKGRADLIARVSTILRDYDAMVMPTVPIVAPKISEFDDDAAYAKLNILSLRNPTVANFLDLCAISLPVQRKGDAPVGLMLVGKHGEDAKLFRIAKVVEGLFRPQV
jgi:aspartyl-tRNA(Asn)/glutamyl-tRNA(Gln) amidotransferase subunit A